MNRIAITGFATGLCVLGACAPSDDPVYTQFFRPVGSIVNDGEFGDANENNTLIQTGQRDYTYSLARRFSSEVESTVTFAFNSAVLDAGAQATLRQQALWIRQFPEIRFRVYGHTDLVGSQAYNKNLGLRRANAVVSFLVGHGISRSRLEAVVSFGETQPLIVTEGRERRNRRTVTEVSGFVKSHPLVLDGKYAEIVYRDYVTSAKAESDLRTLESGQLEVVAE